MYVIVLLTSLLFLLGCRDPKSTGPELEIPASSTKLFIAECDPFDREPGLLESVTLVVDPADACNTDIDFVGGHTATFRSNTFRAPAGTYTEGVHLVFERNIEHSQSPAMVSIDFRGIAVNLQRDIELPLGETRTVIEISETATTTGPADSNQVIELTLAGLPSTISLDAGSSTGTFVFTEADRSNLCEFRVLPFTGDGTGRPNEGLALAYEFPGTSVQSDVFLDFSGGAELTGNGIVFGPRYGAVYLAAESDGCRDTLVLWAPAPAQGYTLEVLGRFTLGNVLSDGDLVWLYDLEEPVTDTTAWLNVRVFYPNDLTLFNHLLYDSTAFPAVHFDQQNSLIWVTQRSDSDPDSAWGYTLAGVLDSLVVAPDFPDGKIYRGNWVYETASTPLYREFSVTPLTALSSQVLGIFPAELTEEFAGGAGIGLPDAARRSDWSINIFDASGAWTASYPIRGGENDEILGVDLITAEDLIVYSAFMADTVDQAIWYEVVALRP